MQGCRGSARNEQTGLQRGIGPRSSTNDLWRHGVRCCAPRGMPGSLLAAGQITALHARVRVRKVKTLADGPLTGGNPRPASWPRQGHQPGRQQTEPFQPSKKLHIKYLDAQQVQTGRQRLIVPKRGFWVPSRDQGMGTFSVHCAPALCLLALALAAWPLAGATDVDPEEWCTALGGEPGRSAAALRACLVLAAAMLGQAPALLADAQPLPAQTNSVRWRLQGGGRRTQPPLLAP